MDHWFSYTGGCTSAQATKLDVLGKLLGMGENAGLELFALAQGRSISRAGHGMSIDRAEQSIAWAREKLAVIRHRRRWRTA